MSAELSASIMRVMAQEAAGHSVVAPSRFLILIGLALAAIVGIVAGALHRSDTMPVMPPLVPVQYSMEDAIVRAASASVASIIPIVTAVISTEPEPTVLAWLVALACAIGYGLIHKRRGLTVRAAIWEGWTAVLAVSTLGQGLMLLLAAS